MSQKYFQIIWPVHVHLKTDKVDLKKRPPWKNFFLHFFSINSSSRHEKRCQMLQRLFWLFQCSKNPLCPVPSTNQSIPSCFYFKISWMLMKQRCFYFFLSPRVSAGPQKPQTLTASKTNYEKFGPKIWIPHWKMDILMP